VRHGRVFILAAVVLTGVTGCANRPNNLETYYDQPGSAASTAAAPSRATPSPAARAQTGSTTSKPNDIAKQVDDAVLTSSDLVHEGVHASTARPENGACFDSVPAGDPRGASWVYNSGSTLIQEVTGYLDKQAADVLTQVQCGGDKLTVQPLDGVEKVRGWCQSGTCTVLLASGHVLSGLQVSASSTSRATDAIRSLVPIAAGKLPGADGR
jgi:hypothetical protein